MFRLAKEVFGRYRDLRKNNNKDKQEITYQVILNGNELNTIVYTIHSFSEKITNLVFKNDLSNEIGYRYVGRKGISTFGLKKRVDVIICDIKMNIIDYYEAMPPQKMTHHYSDARYIFIFSQDFIKRHNIKIKDVLTTKKITEY